MIFFFHQLGPKQPEATELTKHKTPDGKSYYNTHTKPPLWNGPLDLNVLKGNVICVYIFFCWSKIHISMKCESLQRVACYW